MEGEGVKVGGVGFCADFRLQMAHSHAPEGILEEKLKPVRSALAESVWSDLERGGVRQRLWKALEQREQWNSSPLALSQTRHPLCRDFCWGERERGGASHQHHPAEGGDLQWWSRICNTSLPLEWLSV